MGEKGTVVVSGRGRVSGGEWERGSNGEGDGPDATRVTSMPDRDVGVAWGIDRGNNAAIHQKEYAVT